MSVDDDWNYDDDPTEPGWYATNVCWESEEGSFPGAGYWNGSKWDPYEGPVVSWSFQRFFSEKEADAWARKKDDERWEFWWRARQGKTPPGNV
jgi:hypothetical protein